MDDRTTAAGVPGRYHRKRRTLGYLFVAGSALLVMGELWLRTFDYEPLKTRIHPLIYERDAELGYRYIPGARRRICVPSICKDIEINEDGFCGPVDPRNKPSGTYRVAVVGSSQATGIWMAEGNPFPHLLEERLLREGGSFEVLNFSVDGQNRDLANIRRVEQVVLDYSPDLVLLNLGAFPFFGVVGYRDMYRGYVYSTGHSDEPQEVHDKQAVLLTEYIDDVEDSLVARVYDASYIFRKLCSGYINWKEANDFHPLDGCFAHRMDAYRRRRVERMSPLPYLTPEESLQRIDELRARCRETGAELVLFLYEDNPEAVQTFHGYGIECISLAIPETPLYQHAHDGHYNDAGHRLVAQRLHDLLIGKWSVAREHMGGAAHRATGGDGPIRARSR